MNILDTLQISASGLAAERVRLQSVASNLANARTTRARAHNGRNLRHYAGGLHVAVENIGITT